MNETVKKHIEDLQLLKNDQDALGNKLIDLGKRTVLTFEEEQILAKEIEPFLYDPREIIREDAIKVLLNYWRIEKYKEVVLGFFMNEKESDDLRYAALSGYGALYLFKNDKRVMQFMYSIFKNKNYSSNIRSKAYKEILYISSLNASEYPFLFFNNLDIDKEADIDLIEKLIKNAK
ncbi:hypothetical protein JJC03_09955 [Flavobacterium oreochromis]|uniref:hypothetical protein n=1 Tax=Flavobacterium oreochromis TaxID=2906078 RepID=UPI000CDAFB99|nr:hypothetical protein [Flavobacterium oreochromis]POR19884.1 hypothetical protein BWK58_14230 [Flavobacterium columnare]QYS85536.1 hypothetical protein JJC03_09955 [Flavobacterium oreochromis]